MHSCTKRTWETKEARDQVNQVRRGRSFWLVVAIPVPTRGPPPLACVLMGGTSTLPSQKGKDKGKNKGAKGKRSSKGKRTDKSDRPDPLKQRLESNTQCRLCGDEPLASRPSES